MAKESQKEQSVSKEKGKYRIFISHKHEDRKAAEFLKGNILDLFGGTIFEVFISEEITPGKEWLIEIKKALKKCDLLFLLFTDPSATWDWCFYELGLFTDKNKEENRLICIHSDTTKPPELLSHIQAVKGESSAFTHFLKDFFGNTKITGLESPPKVINPPFEDALKEAAGKFCSMIAGASKRNCLLESIKILTYPQNTESDNFLENAEIDASYSTFRMFGLQDSPPSGDKWKWSELLKQAEQLKDKKWISELVSALQEVYENRIPKPFFSTFKSMFTGKPHCPVLYSCETKQDGSKVFEILFIETESKEK